MTYVGEFEYEDHKWTQLPDRNDQRRDAIRFELVPAGGLDMDVGNRNLDAISMGELRNQAEASVSGEQETTTHSTSRTTYQRSEVVNRYAHRVADGICQGCGEEAPFLDEDGEPFLEVHHLHRRSDGGPDHPRNVIAICPNCHRRVHHGQNGEEFNQRLIEKAQQREKSI